MQNYNFLPKIFFQNPFFFTVAENTPDEVYYQSYNAYGMGWKINVLNEGEEPNSVGKLFEHYKFALTYFLVLLLALFHPNFWKQCHDTLHVILTRNFFGGVNWKR